MPPNKQLKGRVPSPRSPQGNLPSPPPQRRSFDDTVSQSLKSLISNISHNDDANDNDNDEPINPNPNLTEEEEEVRVTVSSPPVIMMQPDGTTIPLSSRGQVTHTGGLVGQVAHTGLVGQGDLEEASEHPLISTDSLDFVSLEDIERNLSRLENGSLFTDPSSDENSFFSTNHPNLAAAEKSTFSSTRELVTMPERRSQHLGVGQGDPHSHQRLFSARDAMRTLTRGSSSSSQVVFFSPLHLLNTTGTKNRAIHTYIYIYTIHIYIHTYIHTYIHINTYI